MSDRVIRLTGEVAARETRELSRTVAGDVLEGARRFVVDLTGATSVQEGPLLLALLSVRAALRRVDGRLVIAAAPPLASRLAANLRHDRALDAAASVAEATALTASPVGV